MVDFPASYVSFQDCMSHFGRATRFPEWSLRLPETWTFLSFVNLLKNAGPWLFLYTPRQMNVHVTWTGPTLNGNYIFQPSILMGHSLVFLGVNILFPQPNLSSMENLKHAWQDLGCSSFVDTLGAPDSKKVCGWKESLQLLPVVGYLPYDSSRGMWYMYHINWFTGFHSRCK